MTVTTPESWETASETGTSMGREETVTFGKGAIDFIH